jgi:hypothetical protein
VRRQVAIQFHFEEEHEALKRFLEDDLITMPSVNRILCDLLAGLDVQCTPPVGAHALTGRRLANLPLWPTHSGGAAHVFELLHRQGFALLDRRVPNWLAWPRPWCGPMATWPGWASGRWSNTWPKRPCSTGFVSRPIVEITGRPLLIGAGHVLTLDLQIGVLSPGEVLVEAGRIEAVAASIDAPHADRLAMPDGIVMSGLDDTHRHT